MARKPHKAAAPPLKKHAAAPPKKHAAKPTPKKKHSTTPTFPRKPGQDQGNQQTLPHGPVLAENPDTPTPDAGGGGGGGGGGAGTPPPDHSDQLGIYGLPPDIAAAVDKIFRDHPNDPEGASQAAIAYVRGTPWYAQTFPGIAQARALGFIGTDLGSEREYKQYYAQYNQLYKQYYGRDMSWQEAFNIFSQGVTPDYLGRTFAGGAYVNANKPDIQYLAGAFTDTGRLNSDQLQAYGYEQAGIDSPLGQQLQTQLQKALQKMQTLFGGSLATPSLGLGGAGLQSQSLLGTKQSPDVQA